MKVLLIILLLANLFILLSLIISKNKIKHKIEDKCIKELDNKIKEKQKYYDDLIAREEEKKNLIIAQKAQIIDKELDEYKAKRLGEIEVAAVQRESELNDSYNELSDKLDADLAAHRLSNNEAAIAVKEELDIILEELAEYKKKQQIINEAIRQDEENRNQIDSHRIILSVSDKEDINFLVEVQDKINNKEILYKLIWSEYLQRPFNQMINNIFGSNIPKNVIYCIENIETHKKYIGKTSAEVSKRWTEHIKSSLNIGGIKKQKIHEALFKHWDEYTFSILEETDKDKLNEREKYYIAFFETDKYGFNLKSGG